MPLDAICINAVSAELSKEIVGAKIDKVQQPAKDIILLTVHGNGQTLRLLLSAGVGTARVHVTNESFENPQSPPMFCMLLRKHLVGARIVGLSQPDFERMLILDLAAYDEMGTEIGKKLIIEMMGRNSNIILTGPEGHIIDSMRRVDGDMSRARQILPGLFYHLPPKQEKPPFMETQVDIILRMISRAGSIPVDKWLLDNFSGLSPLVCREMCFLASGETSKPFSLLAEGETNRLRQELEALQRRVDGKAYSPTMILQNGKPGDFSFFPIKQYENLGQIQIFDSFSELLESFFSRKDKQEQMRRKAQSLLKSVKSAHERSLRKLGARREELRKTGERELSRKRGELITANLHHMKKGDRLLVTEDYYEESCPKIEISLDPLKTPQENAAAYYKEYNKAKTAEKYLGELIFNGEKEEAYLASVIDIITRAESERDLAEIRRELIETGFVRQQKTGKKEKIKETSPLRFVSSSGMEILVGKNNNQNDKLTTKLSLRNDMWLHVQKLHGSHVVIKCNDQTPDDRTIKEAASLAVYYSQGREGGKTPVDYTQIRYVKKPSGAMPGAVIYTDYKTIFTEGDETLAEKLKA